MQLNQSKILTILSLGICAPYAWAASVPVSPGGPAVIPGSNATAPGAVVFVERQDGTSSSNPAVSVSVTEYVVQAGGVPDFYYKITNTSTIDEAFGSISLTDYTRVSTAVANNTATIGATPAGTIPAIIASRTASGDTLNFEFAGNALNPGTSTEWLEIDTTGLLNVFSQNATVTLDNGIITLTQFQSPIAPAPEPLTLGLLAGGLALLAIVHRRSTQRSTGASKSWGVGP